MSSTTIGYAESLPQEKDYLPAIEGKIPQGLEGTLYRNGAGLFDRAGYRKKCLLDGDGLSAIGHDLSEPQGMLTKKKQEDLCIPRGQAGHRVEL